ncbi:MAG: class I SAM-dependent methyltransferase [Candidatus Polarisedimenticolia bacterium]
MGAVSALGWIGRYGRVSPAAAAHLSFRWLGFPHFHRLVSTFPASGRILDVGCGHGLLALMVAEGSRARDVVGIDLLEARLEVARAVARRRGLANVRFERRDIEDPPDGLFDAIVVADVLFYRPLPAQRKLLRILSARLSAGGVLLIKEQTREPAWKSALVRLQEYLVVGVKVTLGGSRSWADMAPSGVHLWSAAQLADELRSLGLETDSERLDRWSYLSHRLFVASAPAARGLMSLRPGQ